MAKKAKPASAYDATTIYNVVVARPIRVGVIKMLPRDAHEMTGEFLQAIIDVEGEDAIDHAEPQA